MAKRQLPEQFAGLEPFIDWALATERELTARRHAVGMAASDPSMQLWGSAQPLPGLESPAETRGDTAQADNDGNDQSVLVDSRCETGLIPNADFRTQKVSH